MRHRSTSTGSPTRGGRSPPASAWRTTSSSARATRATSASSRSSSERIRDNGRDDVYQDVYAGLYCVGCEAFKTEEELVDGKCPEHDIEPEWIEERNWFFRLSAYQEQLLALYDERPDFVLPAFRANEARTFVAGGLQDFSISRAGQPWGIPIPWDPEQVAYVWADALVNYLSALTYARPGENLVDRFWPAAHHLLAKDILRFHCVYWPAMLLAAGYEPPQQLFVHGYLLSGDRKVSKSLGNLAADPLDLLDVYGADAIRFWCARSVSFGQDGIAAVEGVRERYERELGNDLGNLLSRVTAMVARYRDGDLRGRAVGRLGRCARSSSRSPPMSPRGSTSSTSRARSSESGRSCAPSTGTSRRRPRGSSRRTRRAADELDRVLYDLVDGLRAVAIALAAYLPGNRRPHPRGARPACETRLGRRRLRPHPRGTGPRGRDTALPARRRARAGGVIDTHAHLDGCDAEPRRAARARAAVGV